MIAWLFCINGTVTYYVYGFALFGVLACWQECDWTKEMYLESMISVHYLKSDTESVRGHDHELSWIDWGQRVIYRYCCVSWKIKELASLDLKYQHNPDAYCLNNASERTYYYNTILFFLKVLKIAVEKQWVQLSPVFLPENPDFFFALTKWRSHPLSLALLWRRLTHSSGYSLLFIYLPCWYKGGNFTVSGGTSEDRADFPIDPYHKLDKIPLPRRPQSWQLISTLCLASFCLPGFSLSTCGIWEVWVSMCSGWT